MGNSLEQTIGLMTAITEQTKNSSKSARGLNAILANLAQVLDPASSNGEKIVEIFDKLGVAMYDTNGQFKSGYDLLSGLAEEWDGLDGNAQKYIATTLAGTTQLNNFLALMNNFGHATKATNTALESQGSALEENERYMGGIEAKMTNLKQVFQDFANNVLDSDFVKALLDVATGFLQLANTDLGVFISQIALLTSLGWGAVSLAKASEAVKIITKLVKGFVGGGATAGGIAAIGATASSVLPVVLALSAAVVGLYTAWKVAKDYDKDFDEYAAEIDDINTKLETNKQRLEDIQDLKWYDKTDDIMAEKDAIEKENEALKEQQDKLAQLALAKMNSWEGWSGGTGYRVTSLGEGKTVDNVLGSQTFSNVGEAQNFLEQAGYIQNASTLTQEALEDMGVVIEKVYGSLDDKLADAAIQLQHYTAEMETNHELTEDEAVAYNKLIDDVKGYASNLQYAADNGLGKLTPAQEKFLEAFNESEDAFKKAKSYIPDYVDSLVEIETKAGTTGDALYTNVVQKILDVNNTDLTPDQKVQALEEIIGRTGNASKELVESLGAAIISTGNTSLNFDQQISVLKALATQANVASGAMQSIFDKAARLKWRKGAAFALSRTFQRIIDNIPEKISLDLGKTTGGGGGGGGGGSAKETDEYLEQLKEIVKLYESQLDLMQERGDSEEDQIAKMKEIQNALHVQADYMRSVGASQTEINALSTKWWQLQGKIEDAQDKILDKEKELLEAEKDRLKTEEDRIKSEYSSIAKYAQGVADARIKEIEDEIDKLQEANDEIDKRIQKEELLDNLAKARQQKKLVFKDGQFQYVSDAEAISSAQANLNQFEREQALQKEIDELNARKQMWEDYKDGWGDLTSDYDDEQGKLLYLQKYGQEVEQETWKTRLDNLESFKDSYIASLKELATAQEKIESQISGLSASKSGGSSSGKSSGSGKANNATATIPGVGTVGVRIENGKTVTSGLPVGTVVKTAGGSYRITGGDANKGGYKSEKVSKHALGTLSAQGGLSLVGEQGPELRVLGQGDGILPADITRNLWDWGKINPSNMAQSLSNVFNIDNLTLPNARDAQTLVNGLRQMAYQRAYKRA